MSQASTLGKGTSAAEMLRNYIERIELINADIDGLKDERKAVVADAAAHGFIPKAMRKVLKLRAMAPADRAEQEHLERTYLHALGLESAPPIASAVELMAIDIASREAVLEALHHFTPTNGSIEIEVNGIRTRLTRDLDGNVTEAVVTAPAPAEPVKLPTRRTERRPPDPASVPDCDREGAEQLGLDAYKQNQPITRNPFPRDDDRRERWDKGWRSGLFGGKADKGEDGKGEP
jgi:uncharacterized protein (UPF0335 family)